MKGAINYLREIRAICQEHSRESCRTCPIGSGELSGTLCPRLTLPATWDDDKICRMVSVKK